MDPRTDITRSHESRSARRGIAMMLVLIAMLVTTVLVAAVITSGENSPAIGNNATDAAEATWSAESAVNFAVGAIERTDDLEALLDGGDKLTDSMTIGDAALDVTVLSLDGNPPAPGDREFVVQATASVNGITKSVTKFVTAISPVSITEAIDMELKEFAIFATESIQIDDGAQVENWNLSPEAEARVPCKVGTGFDAPSDLTVTQGPGASNIAVFTDTNASPGLEELAAALGVKNAFHIPIEVPALPMGDPNGFDALPQTGADVAPADAESTDVPAPAAYQELIAANSATVNIDGAFGPMYEFSRFTVTNRAVVNIKGDVHIRVSGDMDLSGRAGLVLEDGASLSLYVAGRLRVRDEGTVFGIHAVDLDTPGPDSLTRYVDPARVKIVMLDSQDGGTGDRVEISNGAIALGMIHAPGREVRIEGGATLIGRVTAGAFYLADGSALLSCPTLDNRMGFTSPTGPLYDDSGAINPGIDDAFDTAHSGSAANTEDFYDTFVTEWDAYVEDVLGTEPAQTSTQTQTQSQTSQLTGMN